MMDIRLSNGGIAVIDDEDYAKVSGLTWFLAPTGYAIASTHVAGEIVNFYMHRVIAGAGDGQKTDHRDGDRLNNRRHNLRLCTTSQNNMNSAKRINTSSRQKGVYWSKQKEKWHARIKLNGASTHLGFFADEIEAGKAYNAAAQQHFGEFARLNTF
jgi:hypothetical protein